jgi:hypothetical protein
MASEECYDFEEAVADNIAEDAKEETTGEHEAGGGPRKPGGKAKAKAKARGLYTKVSAGMKFCAPCGKEHPVSEFAAGKPVCGPVWNAMRNLGGAAARQQQSDWWEAVKANPKLLKTVVAAYFIRVQPEVGIQGAADKKGKAKRDAFCIGTYREEVKRAEQLLKDGVYEMMNEAAYCHFAGKAKNGGIGHDEAKQLWLAEFAKAGAITDALGHYTYT